MQPSVFSAAVIYNMTVGAACCCVYIYVERQSIDRSRRSTEPQTCRLWDFVCPPAFSRHCAMVYIYYKSVDGFLAS